VLPSPYSSPAASIRQGVRPQPGVLRQGSRRSRRVAAAGSPRAWQTAWGQATEARGRVPALSLSANPPSPQTSISTSAKWGDNVPLHPAFMPTRRSSETVNGLHTVRCCEEALRTAHGSPMSPVPTPCADLGLPCDPFCSARKLVDTSNFAAGVWLCGSPRGSPTAGAVPAFPEGTPHADPLQHP